MAEAEGAETMSPSLRLRFRGCANTITRHGQQAEKTLDQRLACDLPADPVAEAAAEAEIIEKLRQTRLLVEAHRKRLADVNPEVAQRTLPAQQGLDQPPWGSAMLAAVAKSAMPPGAASAA
jgi:hypothetical protein